MDAADFVFAPFLGFLWGAAWLFVRAASGRKRYNVLGALDTVTHRLIGVTNHDYINAESVCVLLRAVAETAVGVPITLVLDNARYQQCACYEAARQELKAICHGIRCGSACYSCSGHQIRNAIASRRRPLS